MKPLQTEGDSPYAAITEESEERLELALLRDPTEKERADAVRQWIDSQTYVNVERVAATLPRKFSAEVHIPDLPVHIDIVISFEGERVRCDRLTLISRGDPIDTEILRKVPMATVLRAAATAALGVEGEGWADLLHFHQVDTDNGPTDEVMIAVAAIYALAFAVGDRPTKAVGQALSVPRSTATGWVAAARRKGFLGETRPRQQGVGT